MRNHGSRWIATLIFLGLFGILAAIRIAPWKYEYGQYTENHLVVVSDRKSGFDFPLANNEIVYNPERLLGPAIFHVGTLLSRAIGRDGGYDGHVLLHWTILVGTALGVAVLVIQTTGSFSGAALAGALALFHGRDSYVNWIGVPNNYFYVFCTVAAVVASVAAFKSRSIPRVLASTTCLICLQWLALGFYEAPMAVFIVTPVFLILAFAQKIWTPSTLKSLLCLVYPAIWVVGYVRLASASDGAVYQKSVVGNITLASSVGGFFEHVHGAVAFWNWNQYVLPGAFALLVVAGSLLAAVLLCSGIYDDKRLGVSIWRIFLGLSILSTAAIAPFAIVSDTGFLRTHLLSAPFVGASLAVLAMAAWQLTRMRTAARTAVILSVGAYMFFGLAASASSGSTHSSNWIANRAVLREIKRVVPDTNSGSLIVIRFSNLDDRLQVQGKLGNDMWLNMHVRSLYRDKVVDGAGMGLWPNDRWRGEGDDWVFVGDFLVPAQERISNENTIILDVVGQSTDGAGDWIVHMAVSPDSLGQIIRRDLRVEEKRRLNLPL